jgi:hypothetical protein
MVEKTWVIGDFHTLLRDSLGGLLHSWNIASSPCNTGSNDLERKMLILIYKHI